MYAVLSDVIWCSACMCMCMCMCALISVHYRCLLSSVSLWWLLRWLLGVNRDLYARQWSCLSNNFFVFRWKAQRKAQKIELVSSWKTCTVCDVLYVVYCVWCVGVSVVRCALCTYAVWLTWVVCILAIAEWVTAETYCQDHRKQLQL